METRLISVIIPAYKAEDTIEKCIQSISDPNVEIIVVVDGIFDRTDEICDQLAQKDTRIKIIKQENQGALKARINGIKEAKGSYVMFLDCDDCYMPNAISKIRTLIETYHEPDLIRFRYQKEPEGYEQYRYFPEGEERYITKQEFSKTIYPIILETYQLNSIWGNCVKKEILEKVELKAQVKSYGEDLLYNLELYTNIENILLTEEILYRYITNSKSITKTRNLEQLFINLQDGIKVYSSFYHYLKRWKMDTEENQVKVQNRLKKETDLLIQIIQEEKNK